MNISNISIQEIPIKINITG